MDDRDFLILFNFYIYIGDDFNEIFLVNKFSLLIKIPKIEKTLWFNKRHRVTDSLNPIDSQRNSSNVWDFIDLFLWFLFVITLLQSNYKYSALQNIYFWDILRKYSN